MYSILGNNMQHILIHTKMIFSWGRKVLGIAKVHRSPGNLQDAVMSGAFVSGIFWCPSCRQVTGPEFLPQFDTMFQLTSLLQIYTRIAYSMLS